MKARKKTIKDHRQTAWKLSAQTVLAPTPFKIARYEYAVSIEGSARPLEFKAPTHWVLVYNASQTRTPRSGLWSRVRTLGSATVGHRRFRMEAFHQKIKSFGARPLVSGISRGKSGVISSKVLVIGAWRRGGKHQNFQARGSCLARRETN